MPNLLKYLGIVVMVLGGLFMAQGGGILPWPSSSFMVGSVHWVFYGGLIILVGFVLYMVSRFLRR